jgi:hypothetical protein
MARSNGLFETFVLAPADDLPTAVVAGRFAVRPAAPELPDEKDLGDRLGICRPME